MMIRGDISIQEAVFGIVACLCMTAIFITIIITEKRNRK